MINTLQRLIDLIDFLKLHKVKPISNKRTLSPEVLGDIITELKIKRADFLKENIKELKQKIKQNFKRPRISTFSLMEYDFDENSHSNILEYLMDYNSFEEGSKIFLQMVMDTSISNKNELSEKILKKTYSIYREYPIPKGRIDLFILDEDEKFVIIIENKIFAEIGKTIGEGENSIEVTQLEKYRNWCEDNYDDYTRLYILLNYSNTDDNTFSFEKISYQQLYNNLKTIESDDNIFDEYLLLLKTMLGTVGQNLFEVKKIAKKIIENEEPDISLTEYYNLKNIFYAK